MASNGQKEKVGDDTLTGNDAPIDLDIEGDNHNTETYEQGQGERNIGQTGDATRKPDQGRYYNEDDLQVWKDRYLRRNEDPSRRDANTGGISAPKEITFKYRRTQPK
ncbi:hypothetical protein ACSBR1_026618 [Camellia fascicularis]